MEDHDEEYTPVVRPHGAPRAHEQPVEQVHEHGVVVLERGAGEELVQTARTVVGERARREHGDVGAPTRSQQREGETEYVPVRENPQAGRAGPPGTVRPRSGLGRIPAIEP